MANGINYEKYISPSPATLMGAEYGGKLRATYDEITFAADALGTVVNLGVLMPGEIFVGATVIHGALGTGVTIQLGDAGDDDRYMAAQVCTNAGVLTAALASGGLGYKNETVVPIPIVLKTGVAAATGKVQVVIQKLAAN